MSDNRFWKIVYLYTTKYNYEVVYYRPEKKDVWLINEDNELIRFIYSQNFNNIGLDSIISNIIKNEERLKKIFKLNSLKIKILCVSDNFNENISEYKKYKISKSLLIERVLLNEKNIKTYISTKDLKFIESAIDSQRYKKRVLESYKNKTNNFPLNIKYNIISVFIVFLFILNYIGKYFTQGKFILYDYLDYDYQSIISGRFYRLFSPLFVANEFESLLLVIVSILCCSILFKKSLNLLNSIIVLIIVTFFLSMISVFNLSSNINFLVSSFLGVLGFLFMNNFKNRKSNNIEFLNLVGLSVIYFGVSIIFFKISILICLFCYVLGIVLNMFLAKKHHSYVLLGYVAICIALGLVVNIFDINLKTKINNYSYSRVEKRLLNLSDAANMSKLENNIATKNKSAVTYYELAMLKLSENSVAESKKILQDGIKYDDTFAPIYYELALIERSESNYIKSKEYAKRAYELEAMQKYKNLLEELEKY